MGLIIKRSMKAFWNTKDWSQNPTSFVLEQFLLETDYPPTDDAPRYMLDFTENERNSRKLKKVQELVQHFWEQCRHYVAKQNKTYKHWWNF